MHTFQKYDDTLENAVIMGLALQNASVNERGSLVQITPSKTPKAVRKSTALMKTKKCRPLDRSSG